MYRCFATLGRARKRTVNGPWTQTHQAQQFNLSCPARHVATVATKNPARPSVADTSRIRAWGLGIPKSYRIFCNNSRAEADRGNAQGYFLTGLLHDFKPDTQEGMQNVTHKP